jgi:hypothetical protein
VSNLSRRMGRRIQPEVLGIEKKPRFDERKNPINQEFKQESCAV